MFHQTIQLAKQFLELLRKHQPEAFDTWLRKCANSGISFLQNFAQGLQNDYDAIKAAMILPISNGQVEGQINRLKTLKRQMYGRASLDLLSRRYILAI